MHAQIDYISIFPIWVHYCKYHEYLWPSEINTCTCRVCQARVLVRHKRHEYYS